MPSEKDKMVDQLIEVVQKKKNEIEKTEKAKWQTNCSFSFNPETNQRINIQTVGDVDTIVSMAAHLVQKMESVYKAASLLEVEANFDWMGFTFEQWMVDFKTRIEKIQISQKKQELKDLETRLDKLVSKERREELELAAIKKQLGVE
jgi:hypothetical protein